MGMLPIHCQTVKDEGLLVNDRRYAVLGFHMSMLLSTQLANGVCSNTYALKCFWLTAVNPNVKIVRKIVWICSEAPVRTVYVCYQLYDKLCMSFGVCSRPGDFTMCGRFTLRAAPEQLADQFDLPEVPPLAPRYNIAPTQPIAAVRENPDSGKREFTFFNWGLIPFWADDPAIGSRMINARAETAADKPSFRAAFKYRRCIVPADGFYEWQKRKDGKQPHLIGLADSRVFGFAGLWEHWERDGSVIESCTLLTTEPNELLSSIHNRMPVILQSEDYAEWLARDVQEVETLRHLLRSFPAEQMVAVPVSTVVNNPRNEDPACVVPIAA